MAGNGAGLIGSPDDPAPNVPVDASGVDCRDCIGVGHYLLHNLGGSSALSIALPDLVVCIIVFGGLFVFGVWERRQ